MANQPGRRRVSVTINQEMGDAMEIYAERKDVSRSEALRRLALLGDAVVQADREGKKILFVGKHETEQVHLI